MSNSNPSQPTILQYAQTADGQQILLPSNQVLLQGWHTKTKRPFHLAISWYYCGAIAWQSTVLQSSAPTIIKHTCLSFWILKTLISCFRCFWLELELNFIGQLITRSRIGTPALVVHAGHTLAMILFYRCRRRNASLSDPLFFLLAASDRCHDITRYQLSGQKQWPANEERDTPGEEQVGVFERKRIGLFSKMK